MKNQAYNKNDISTSQPGQVKLNKPWHNYAKIPSKFDGTEDYSIWEADMMVYFEQFKEVSVEEKFKILKASITGSARLILQSTPYLTTSTGIFNALRCIYDVTTDWMAKAAECIQLPNENVSLFATRLRVLVIKAMTLSGFTTITSDQIDNLCLTFFKKNVRPEIAKRLISVLPKNMGSALTFACSYEIDVEDEEPTKKQLKLTKPETISELDSEEKDFKNTIKNSFKQVHEKLAFLSKSIPQKPQPSDVTGIRTNNTLDLVNQEAMTVPNLNALIDSRLQDSFTRYHFNRFNNPDAKTNTYNTGYKQGDINNDTFRPYPRNSYSCFHCHKPGHSYIYCRSATDSDKQRITTKLSDRDSRAIHLNDQDHSSNSPRK